MPASWTSSTGRSAPQCPQTNIGTDKTVGTGGRGNGVGSEGDGTRLSCLARIVGYITAQQVRGRRCWPPRAPPERSKRLMAKVLRGGER